MKTIFVVLLSLLTFSVLAQSKDAPSPKIIYKYKKYQKFDFEDMVIEGETGSPGDLSIAPRMPRTFRNKLPYRKNFNAEIRKGIERIR